VNARMPGRCACCGRAYSAGAEIERGPAGWTRSACLRPPPPPMRPDGSSSAEEVAEVLVRARRAPRR